MAEARSTFLSRLDGRGDILLASALFGLLAIILVPLPTIVLDLLLATSISISLLLFLATLYAKKPVDFSVFPSLLLITTMFRLALNIASTRLILLHDGQGGYAAGRVIEAFGRFVVGGSYIVGLVIFAILVVINFIVITKGSGRVAEVAARFTLDAMPGKQMAIDAELNAGLIDETTARTRRAEVSREADFYGSMDGASKFIRGDAIAGLIITFVNIIGGVFIGTIQQGMPIGEALKTYTILTIGDGLVGQVPALIVSLAAGLLVTRVQDSRERPLAGQLTNQLFAEPRAWLLVSAALMAMAMIPGLFVPFAGLAAVIGWIGWQSFTAPEVEEAEPEPMRPDAAEARPEDLLPVEPLALEVAVDLLYLVDERRGGELVDRIQSIRKQFATELGVVLPPVHLRDNLMHEQGEYRMLLRGEEIGRGVVRPRQHLALDPGGAEGKLKGVATRDPVFGLPAYWIGDNQMLKAQALGYAVVDVPTVLTTHLVELMHLHAHELFDGHQLARITERVAADNPRLIDDLMPDPLPRHAVLRVFRSLIREGISTRDAQSIFEALSDFAHHTADPDVLVEFVRQRLARHITRRFSDEGAIHFVQLGPEAEDAVLRGLQNADGRAPSLVIDPSAAREIVESIRALTEGYSGPGQAVVICPPLARGALRRLTERTLPRVPILSSAEILPTVRLEPVGTVSLRRAAAQRG